MHRFLKPLRYTLTERINGMIMWPQNRLSVSRREAGAGAVAAGAALVAALLCIPGLWVLDALSGGLPRSTELYFFGYVGFVFYALLLAPLVGLVAGTVVWRWLVPPSSDPRQGAIAGVVSALVTILLVPLLFSLLLLAWELIRAAWWTPESYRIFASPSQLVVVVTHGGLLYWGPLAGVVLVPLGAIVGWAYQHRQQHRGP